MGIQKTQVLILGSGPAGLTAAIYTARAGLETTVIAGQREGGQLTISAEVANFPGFPEPIAGQTLMQSMIVQTKSMGANLVSDHVEEVSLSQQPYQCITTSGVTYQTEALIIATGAQSKWLGLESETKFKGFGVSSCATCDAFFFRDKVVAVVGGGNTGVEEAIYLTNHARKVYLIHRRDTLTAEQFLQERALSNKKIEFLWNSSVVEILGTDKPKSVTGVKIKNNKTGEIRDLELDGVFIAIGYRPSTELFQDTPLKINERGYIITEPGSTKTSLEGVFAAGDVQDEVYRQAITAAGSGCKAALDAYRFLQGKVSYDKLQSK